MRAVALAFRWPNGNPTASVNGAAVVVEQPSPGRPVWQLKLPPGAVEVRITRAR